MHDTLSAAALGLRPLPREISVVLADPILRTAVGGLRQITAPVDELAGLQIHPDAVLIVENKEPALAWSDTTGLAVIHSLGNHLDVLSRLPWIRPDSCWYWGDLDRHGFTLLSRARTMVPQLASLLMAPGDIETYRSLGVEEDLDRYDQPDSTLTLAEANALAALQLTDGKHLRTEQERIPISDDEHALKQARNLVQLNVTDVLALSNGTLDLGSGHLSATLVGLSTNTALQLIPGPGTPRRRSPVGEAHLLPSGSGRCCSARARPGAACRGRRTAAVARRRAADHPPPP